MNRFIINECREVVGIMKQGYVICPICGEKFEIDPMAQEDYQEQSKCGAWVNIELTEEELVINQRNLFEHMVDMAVDRAKEND